PNDRFRWRTVDASYFEWASHVGVPPTSKLASETALREVARFAATYPVFVAHVALHKLVAYVDVDAFNGIVDYPQLDYRPLRGLAVWLLLGATALSLLLHHESRRTLLLGSPLFFNLPLFLFFFSDGMRHVAPVTASLLVTATPLLAEGGLYRTVAGRRRRALGVAAAFAILWLALHWADRALLASDHFRYWTPFLDP